MFEYQNNKQKKITLQKRKPIFFAPLTNKLFSKRNKTRVVTFAVKMQKQRIVSQTRVKMF